MSRRIKSYAEYMALWELLSADWQKSLLNVKSSIERIDHELASMQTNGTEIAPEESQIFAALPASPDSIKVIIVGQDPYPTQGRATGMAFSVPSGTHPLPPTLRNILRELHDDTTQSSNTQDNLSTWRDQGVLLLNRVLTTEVGVSFAHQSLGWQEVTVEIVRSVRRENPDVVGVLWGRHAQELAKEFKPKQLVLSVHPSPLSAYRGFFGSKPFTRVNELLAESGQTTIKW